MEGQNNIYSGEYQDIEVDGKLLKKGKRECTNRWEIIKKHIRPNSSVIDIGSFHGFFGIKICREIKDTTVLSIETNPVWAGEQKQIVIENNLTNMIVSKHSFSLNDLKWLDTVVEGIDYFLMLSVLEYFPSEDIDKSLKIISQICPKLIIEYPDKNEVKAAGIKNIIKFSPFIEYLKKYFEKVSVIGETEATTDHSLRRKIYLAENTHLIRTDLFSSKDHIKSRKHILEYVNNLWEIKEVKDQNREWFAGFNLHNLLKFNIIYPEKEWFLKEAYNEYRKIFERYKNISDISLKNILFTSNGLKVIDYLEIKKIDNYDKFNEEFKRFVIRPLNES